jgi:hypothetical protein
MTDTQASQPLGYARGKLAEAKNQALEPSTATQARKTSTGAPARSEATTEPPRSKYGAVPVVVNGIRFASKREAARYETLVMLERAGEIRALELQPKYRLEVNGSLIGTYRPDFQYVVMATGQVIVEDVKSKPTVTEAYKLRKKLMKALYNIDIKEVHP